jgi:hypothetical protein
MCDRTLYLLVTSEASLTFVNDLTLIGSADNPIVASAFFFGVFFVTTLSSNLDGQCFRT